MGQVRERSGGRSGTGGRREVGQVSERSGTGEGEEWDK